VHLFSLHSVWIRMREKTSSAVTRSHRLF